MVKFCINKKFILIFVIIFSCFFTSIPYASATSNSKYVYLVGDSFGIKMFTKGAMITGLENFQSDSGLVCPAKSDGLEINDNIICAEDIQIQNNEMLEDIIRNCNGDDLDLIIERNNETFEIEVTPIKNENGVYKIGAWIRDSCSGIGTISYYDKDYGIYAGLGHGICDIDTGQLINLNQGNICNASIVGVTKAKSGVAGTLNGYLQTSDIGNMIINSESGVYGNYTQIDNRLKMQVANVNEVKTGKATIYTTIDSCGIKEFDANIIDICNTDCNNNKNFVIEITDNDLLSVTGGIVQGMSGSPVVQNGKIVGAINHVFINSPEKGYCIFAQNMVSNFETYHNILK